MVIRFCVPHNPIYKQRIQYKQNLAGKLKMDYLPTKASSNHSMQITRLWLIVFTQYSIIRHNKVHANNGWQPKAVLISSFISTFSFLKPVYIGIKSAVNYVQLNKLRQYNKSINADCRADVFFPPARCAAGYFKR